MLTTPSPQSKSSVFSSVLLSDEIGNSHSHKKRFSNFSFASRANEVAPTDSSVDISFDDDDDVSDSYMESSESLEMSPQEFNAKPLSWRVSYVVMRQFQANLHRERTEHSHERKQCVSSAATLTIAGNTENTKTNNISNHVDLATQSNFYDIDASHKKRLARASFFKSALPDKNQLKLANKRRCCLFMDKYVLTPDHLLRQVWDIAVLFLLLYTLIFLPLKVAFYSNTNQTEKRSIEPGDIAVDILFFIDIIMSFVTAMKLPDGTLIRRFDDIAISYLKTWFILDVIATFPFYLIGSSNLERIAPLIRIPRLLKMLRLVRLVKLVRAYRLKKFFEKVEYSPKIHQGFIRIIKLLLLVICFAHFSACLWFFIGDLSEDSHGFSWISDIESVYGGVKDESTSIQYIASLYFAISTLSTVGFGDITPQNGVEMGFAIILMLIGATTFSYITATISSVMHDFDLKASLYRSKMANLVMFVKTSSLTKKLSNKLINDMSAIWRSEIKTNEDTSKLRDELPRLLLYEVSLEMHAHLINTSAFFRLFDNVAQDEAKRVSKQLRSTDINDLRDMTASPTVPPAVSINGLNDSQYISDFSFIGELVSEMRPETAFDGEFIANVAEPVNFWAIIKSGSVVGISAIDSSLELMLWGDGDSLGEVGIFLTQQWPWNMRCTEDTAYFTVSTSDFLAIIAHHRSVSRKLVKLAGQRIERIVKIKKKLRNIQENKIRKSFSRTAKQFTEDKAKLHYRLQNLINYKKDERKDTANTAAADASFINGDCCMSQIAKKIQDIMEDDPIKGTAKGRWKMLRLYVFHLIQTTKSKRDKFRINFQEVTQLAMQVKRFQDALDEIQRDMIVWKQGMTFKANRSNRNFLQPAISVMHEE